MPVASTSPVGQLGQHLEREPPGLLGEPAGQLGGQRVPATCPPGRARRPGDGTRLLASQPPTRRVQRSASGLRPTRGRSRRWAATTGVAVGVGRPRRAGRPTAPPRRAARPRARRRAARAATALRSRTAESAAAQHARRLPRPSGRAAAPRGVRRRRPPPPRSGRRARRRASTVASSGTSSTGSRVVRPPRSARPTSPGRTTASPSRGTSRRRRSAPRPGCAASAGETVRRADAGRALAAVVVDVRAAARVAAGDSSASARSARPGVGGLRAGTGAGRSTQAGHRPAARRPRPLSARSPPGASQASARSSSRSSAAAVRVLVGVDDRDQVGQKWFDLQPRGHQARKARGGPGRRARGGSTNAWRPARPAATES